MVDTNFKRTNVYVLGPTGCGKSTLINTLIKQTNGNTAYATQDFNSSSTSSLDSTSSSLFSLSSPTPKPSTQGSIVIHSWRLDRSLRKEYQINDGDSCDEESEDTIIQIWDLSGKESHLDAHLVYMKTPCLILLLTPSDGDMNGLPATIDLIQDKCPGCRIIIVLTLCDLVTEDANKELTMSSEEISCDVKERLDLRRRRVSKHIADVSSDVTALMNGDNCNKDTTEAKNAFLARSNPTMRAISPVGNLAEVNDAIFNVSTVNGMGLHQLRKAILEMASNSHIFPHLSKEKPELTKYAVDVIEDGKCAGDVLYPIGVFREVVCKRLPETSTKKSYDLIEDAVSFLESSGFLFKLPGFTFFDENHEDKNTSEPNSFYSENEGFVCIDAEAFANMILDCLMVDESKTFRLEANRFWPKESGFKPPDTELLARVLECLPNKGIIRESVLPILWKKHDLSEVQIKYAVRCLHTLGVLYPVDCAVEDCAGLAMPNFPRLSPVRCHGSTLMNMTASNRPQLNWTAEPFIGDVQLTWKIRTITPFPHTACRRCLAFIKALFQSSLHYTYLWEQGLLIKFIDATVCIERSPDALDIACRANGDDPSTLHMSVQVMWSWLIPVVDAVRRFLDTNVPGLVSQTMLRTYGAVFHSDNKQRVGRDLSMVECLSMWQHNKTQGGDTFPNLNLQLLFPFKDSDNIWTSEDWIKLVLEKRWHVLSQMRSDTDLHFSTKRKNSRAKPTRRRKAVEVQWKSKIAEDLEETEHDSLQGQTAEKADINMDKVYPNAVSPVRSPVDVSDHESTERTTTSLDLTPEKLVRATSPRKWREEATARANRFVAFIMAVSVADYVTSIVNQGLEGHKIIGAAKATAARVTADAATAVQNGDLEGAARAVIGAVQAVQSVSEIDFGETDDKLREKHRSRLCTVT